MQASALVTASTGASMPVDLRQRAIECAPEGSFHLRSEADDGKAVAALGPAVRRATGALGVTQPGQRRVVAGEIHECSPCTRLGVQPALARPRV